MSTGLKRLNEQSYNPGLNGNIMDPLVHIPFKRQDDEKALSGLQSFSRASTATYIDSLDGLVKTALADTPRFEKMSDGGTGILMEGASTNLVIQSTNMLASEWLRFLGSSVTTATSPSPSGSIDAFTLTFNGTTNGQVVNIVQGLVVGTTYTLSAYIKNTIAGQKLSVVQAPSGGILQTLWRPSDVWTRQTIKFVATATSANLYFVTNNIGSIDIWGAQLEPLPFASSYIPTTTALVTRAADLLTISMSGNSTLGSDSHTIVFDYQISLAITPYNDFLSIYNYNGPNSYDMFRQNPGGYLSYFHGYGSPIGNITKPVGSVARVVAVIDSVSQTVELFADGVSIGIQHGSLTTNTPPVITFLGKSRIRNFRIYDRALTLQEIQLA